MSPVARRLLPVLSLGLAVAAAGCGDRMQDQPRREGLEGSAFFPDGMAARPLVEGTVPRGHLDEDVHLVTGLVGGKPAAAFPFPVTRDLLERGRERYDIFCAPCHGAAGHGRGIVVRRGFKPPPSFHDDRLREAPPGHFVDVITRGFGAMPDYAAQLPPPDRWAVTAYVRALQLSQGAKVEDLPPEDRRRIEEGR